jgi:hypothetical protein
MTPITALAERAAVTLAAPKPLPADIEKVLVEGNLAALKPEQRVSYYNATCQSLGLNPLTTPFDYLNLNGKLRLYAKKDATDQLRRHYGVSIHITAREVVHDVYVVTARALLPSGREDESTGAVTVKGKSGEDLANAWMKAETKAKRRVTLSICGLGFLDESELESVRGARVVSASQAHSVARITSDAGDTVNTTTGEVLDAETVLRVKHIDSKSGKTSSGREYTYYDVTFSDGRTARTFSRTDGELAAEALEGGAEVRATRAPGKRGGLDLTAIAFAERQPGDEPTDAFPGDNRSDEENRDPF